MSETITRQLMGLEKKIEQAVGTEDDLPNLG